MSDIQNPNGPGSTPPPKPPAPPAAETPPPSAPPAPTASIEPAAQSVAGMTNPIETTNPKAPASGEKSMPNADKASTRPVGGDGAPSLLPAPASYELPDEYAETWFTGAKRWVEEHPALAVAAAAGVGLVIGRLVVAMAPEPEPTLVGRVERRARDMRKDFRKEAKGLLKDARSALNDVKLADTTEAMQEKLRHAAASIAEATEGIGGRASHAFEGGGERTRDLADSLSEAVRTAVSGVVSKAVDEWTARRK